ncbi:hypothetical protein [Sulfurimonas sp.]
MNKIYALIMAVLTVLSIVGCNGAYSTPIKAKKLQDVQIFTSKNEDKKITTKTIEDAFDSLGLSVPGNNDMNKPFKTRFGKVHYKIYNLAMYVNNDITYKIIKKYPKFGALTPLTMSIWQDKEGNMNISTLTIHAMSRATGVPMDNPDLIAYNTLIKKALQKAMPNGQFKALNYTVKFPNKSFAIDMTAQVDKDIPAEDFIEDFEAEFEGELEPLGFLLPNYTNIQEEIFDDHEYHAYDFFHTYSICKFDIIYPVSKLHPEAGAWAPCSFYLYKKKDEKVMHMGFLGVDNWITTLNITDQKSVKPLKEAEKMIVNILKEMTGQ